MSRFMHTRYAPLDAYVPGEQPRDKKYIKLNTNESPYPPPAEVAEVLTKQAADDLRLYPDPDALPLKKALADFYNVGADNVFLTNGSDDILNFAFMAFGEKGVAFADITYGFYKVIAQLNCLEAEVIPLKEDFTLDYSDYLGLNKLIAIANPNAPTGMPIPLWQVEEILKSNPDSVVLIDEAYVDFGGESAVELTKKYDNLLVVMTFSKSRSMAGARLGFAIGCADIIADLEKLKYSTNPYNIDRLTQLCGLAAVENNGYFTECCKKIQATREHTALALEKLGFTVLPSQANFLFASCPGKTGAELYAALRDRGILVRYFSGERTGNFIRITVGSDEEMDVFIAAVKDILN